MDRTFSQTLRSSNKDKDLQEYVCLREYLVVHVLEWKHQRPKLFKQVVEALGMVNLPEPQEEDLVDELVKAQLESNFAFSSYLALNVEKAVKDSIELHAVTWVTIIILCTAYALMARFNGVTLLGTMPVVVSLALMIVCFIVVMTGWRHRSLAKVSSAWMDAAMSSRSIRRKSYSGSAPRPPKCATGERPLEKYLMRFLQIFLFVISYTFSRTIIAFKDWEEQFDLQMPMVAFFVILFMLLLFVLPSYVPVFLELMALPPFVDKENLNNFFAVIDEGFATRFKHEASIKERKRRNSQGERGGVGPKLSSLGSLNSMTSSMITPPRTRLNDDHLVVLSELVDVLQNCTTLDDLKSLRGTLASQLPAGMELPESSSGGNMMSTETF